MTRPTRCVTTAWDVSGVPHRYGWCTYKSSWCSWAWQWLSWRISRSQTADSAQRVELDERRAPLERLTVSVHPVLALLLLPLLAVAHVVAAVRNRAIR